MEGMGVVTPSVCVGGGDRDGVVCVFT